MPFYFLFIGNHRRSLIGFSNYPLLKKVVLSGSARAMMSACLIEHEGRTQWFSCPCSSMTTQQKRRMQSTFWSYQLLQMVNTKNAVWQLPWAGLRNNQFWVISADTQRILWSLERGTRNVRHEKNFFPKMHTVGKKGHSPGLADGLTDFFSARQKEKMHKRKAKSEFLGIGWA